MIIQNNLNSSPNMQDIDDFGLISLMYHRFEENKYPSTNIRIDDFKKHIKILQENNIRFINPKNFENEIKNNKKQRKILLTIDDGFSSFYQNAWPLLKKEKIPFILFVSTREVGAFNYMTWDQIREISKEDFVEIGNHSHTHEYLVDESKDLILDDIKKSISIFKDQLGKNSEFFSYPFGEYSLEFKKLIKSLGFKYAFGQHSGVIDETKDFYELPRFPINEKYGELKRFNSIINYSPLEYKSLKPIEKKLDHKKNPPQFTVEFFNEQKNLENINCYSNEGGKWERSNITVKENKLSIKFREPFTPRRGRINCSLNDDGKWRWFGTQFTIAKDTR